MIRERILGIGRNIHAKYLARELPRLKVWLAVNGISRRGGDTTSTLLRANIQPATSRSHEQIGFKVGIFSANTRIDVYPFERLNSNSN